TFWAGVTNWAPTTALIHAAEVHSLLVVRVSMLANWSDGLQFSLALMGILEAHEFGHYLFKLYYLVPSTPPLFIPFPVSSLGTCGAVIAMQGGEADRRQIFDIGLAGPIAGLCVAIPILIYAMWHPHGPEYGPYKMMALGQPLIVQWLAQWLVPGDASRYVSMLNTESNPLLMAAWSGLLVTGLNMIPVGQLDGGHVSFGLFGPRSTWVGLAVLALTATYLVVFGVVYNQMHIFTPMYFLALLMGPRHPPSRDDTRKLGWPRQIIGWASLVIPLLCIPANPIVPV
ncbi:MAG: site-2 protease family protein, partial [Pirellulaceae bacterium]|nr:site-2 protease family protein [Pirellulaceae bacterium]